MSELEETVREEKPEEDEIKEETRGEETGGEISFQEDDDNGEDYLVRQRKRKRKRLIIGGAVLAAAVIAVGAGIISHSLKGGDEENDVYVDEPAQRRTVSNTITGSSYIEPNDSYNVISMHSGDITSDYISEGDKVKKGDKLYQFDDEDARNQLTSAKNNLTKAQQQYADAVKAKSQTLSSNSAQTASAQNAVERALNSLNDADSALQDRYIVPDISGKVSAVYAENGSDVQNGAQIADIYDDSVMKLRLPFNEFDAENVYEGAAAEVSVAGAGETIWGTVTETASASTASDAHTMVVYATIEVANPGALTASDVGSAVVNGAACADTASFEYAESRTITAKAAGTLTGFDISEGDAVYAGERLGYIDSDQLETAYDNARLSYDDAVLSLQRQVINNDTYSQDSNIKNAQLSLDDARLQVQNAQDAVDDFVVEAPIDGTVVTKNAKSGDTVDSANGGNTDPLCVIYDLSSVKLSIDVDETEVALVKVGQTASVTADAVDGRFEGKVVKVPVDGVNENGVTTYTIDIQIDDYGDLLPGMNVDAEIIVEEAVNAVTVPVSSVNRGNIVFVKDTGEPHINDVTDMLSGGDGDEKASAPESTRSAGAPSDGMRESSRHGAAGGGAPVHSAGPSGAASEASETSETSEDLPVNIEGYRAIKVETGINDSDYIEIKSGINEGDVVRAVNAFALNDDVLSDDMEDAFSQMGGGMGGPGGGMGGPGGGR